MIRIIITVIVAIIWAITGYRLMAKIFKKKNVGLSNLGEGSRNADINMPFSPDTWELFSFIIDIVVFIASSIALVLISQGLF